ncbi:MAG: hypothetical protein QGH20_03455 [Candidatus Latescibacteria bacterium]|nr:hypothetical protein [Candidatus Latescibacterota bacterium]
MDYYHLWCDLKNPGEDLEFCKKVDAYLGQLALQGHIDGHQITRRKLALGPSDLGDFHIVISVADLGQLDGAFSATAVRTELIDEFHRHVSGSITGLEAAFCRDFHDLSRASLGD